VDCKYTGTVPCFPATFWNIVSNRNTKIDLLYYVPQVDTLMFHSVFSRTRNPEEYINQNKPTIYPIPCTKQMAAGQFINHKV